MFDFDFDGFVVCGDVGVKKVRWKKGNFFLKGLNWVYFLDGYDKLMGF